APRPPEPLPLLRAAGVERPQRVGSRAGERADERAVVVVADLARAVVELELLERGEGAIALVEEREPLLLLGRRRIEPVVDGTWLAQERKRDEHDRHDGDQRAHDQGGHARASASLEISRRCSRASGPIAPPDPIRNPIPPTP